MSAIGPKQTSVIAPPCPLLGVKRTWRSYRDGGAIKFEMFINSLSPSEYKVFETWWRGLLRGDQDAILGAISQ